MPIRFLDRCSLTVRQIPLAIREWAVRLILLVAISSFLLKLGLDIPFMLQWTGYLISLTPLVILIAAAALALALLLAVIVTAGRLSTNAIARASAVMFVSIVRGAPLIVILFFIFVAIPQLASDGPEWLREILVLSPTLTAILAIGVFHAAYISELFRAGFLSVQQGQWEAASAIGMSSSQMRRRIIWPQAVRFALRPTANHFVMMLKDTALVGFLGVPILFQRAERIGSQNLKMFETILISALIYWLLTAVWSRLVVAIDRRVFSR